MSVMVLNYVTHLTGTVTSTIDAFLGLKKFIDVETKTIVDGRLSGLFPVMAYHNFGDNDVIRSFTKDRCFECDTLVISSATLHTIHKCGFNRIQCKCKTVVVLDSLSDYNIHTSKELDLFQSLYKQAFGNAKLIYLANPWSIQFAFGDKYVYYHKCITDRLRMIRFSPSNGVFNRGYEDFSNDIRPDSFSKSSMIYRRRLRDVTEYHDNIGKMMFEFYALGRPAFYDASMYRDDGVSEYLKYLGLDPKVTQPVKFDRKLLEFTNTDLLLQVVT